MIPTKAYQISTISSLLQKEPNPIIATILKDTYDLPQDRPGRLPIIEPLNAFDATVKIVPNPHNIKTSTNTNMKRPKQSILSTPNVPTAHRRNVFHKFAHAKRAGRRP